MQKTGGYGTLRWFHCSEKQKVSFTCRSTTDCKKHCRVFFAYVLTGKRSANQRKKNTGLWLSIKSESTCKNSAHLDEKKNRPKFDIEWLCCNVFNYLSLLNFLFFFTVNFIVVYSIGFFKHDLALVIMIWCTVCAHKLPCSILRWLV